MQIFHILDKLPMVVVMLGVHLTIAASCNKIKLENMFQKNMRSGKSFVNKVSTKKYAREKNMRE